MTPPEALRRAADILEQGHARRDQQALPQAAAIIWDVFVALHKAIDPDPVDRAVRAFHQRRNGG